MEEMWQVKAGPPSRPPVYQSYSSAGLLTQQQLEINPVHYSNPPFSREVCGGAPRNDLTSLLNCAHFKPTTSEMPNALRAGLLLMPPLSTRQTSALNPSQLFQTRPTESACWSSPEAFVGISDFHLSRMIAAQDASLGMILKQPGNCGQMDILPPQYSTIPARLPEPVNKRQGILNMPDSSPQKTAQTLLNPELSLLQSCAMTRSRLYVTCGSGSRSGELILGDLGQMGIVCSCHGMQMSVANFTKHVGLCVTNLGNLICMESGETLVQWRRRFFSLHGVKVPDDHAGWDWNELLSSEAGQAGLKAHPTKSWRRQSDTCYENEPSAAKSRATQDWDSCATVGNAAHSFLHGLQASSCASSTILRNSQERHDIHIGNLERVLRATSSANELAFNRLLSQGTLENPRNYDAVLSSSLKSSENNIYGISHGGGEGGACRDFITRSQQGLPPVDSHPHPHSHHHHHHHSVSAHAHTQKAPRMSHSPVILHLEKETVTSNFELRLGQPSQKMPPLISSPLSLESQARNTYACWTKSIINNNALLRASGEHLQRDLHNSSVGDWNACSGQNKGALCSHKGPQMNLDGPLATVTGNSHVSDNEPRQELTAPMILHPITCFDSDGGKSQVNQDTHRKAQNDLLILSAETQNSKYSFQLQDQKTLQNKSAVVSDSLWSVEKRKNFRRGSVNRTASVEGLSKGVQTEQTEHTVGNVQPIAECTGNFVEPCSQMLAIPCNKESLQKDGTLMEQSVFRMEESPRCTDSACASGSSSPYDSSATGQILKKITNGSHNGQGLKAQTITDNSIKGQQGEESSSKQLLQADNPHFGREIRSMLSIPENVLTHELTVDGLKKKTDVQSNDGNMQSRESYTSENESTKGEPSEDSSDPQTEANMLPSNPDSCKEVLTLIMNQNSNDARESDECNSMKCSTVSNSGSQAPSQKRVSVSFTAESSCFSQITVNLSGRKSETVGQNEEVVSEENNEHSSTSLVDVNNGVAMKEEHEEEKEKEEDDDGPSDSLLEHCKIEKKRRKKKKKRRHHLGLSSTSGGIEEEAIMSPMHTENREDNDEVAGASFSTHGQKYAIPEITLKRKRSVLKGLRIPKEALCEGFDASDNHIVNNLVRKEEPISPVRGQKLIIKLPNGNREQQSNKGGFITNTKPSVSSERVVFPSILESSSNLSTDGALLVSPKVNMNRVEKSSVNLALKSQKGRGPFYRQNVKPRRMVSLSTILKLPVVKEGELISETKNNNLKTTDEVICSSPTAEERHCKGSLGLRTMKGKKPNWTTNAKQVRKRSLLELSAESGPPLKKPVESSNLDDNLSKKGKRAVSVNNHTVPHIVKSINVTVKCSSSDEMAKDGLNLIPFRRGLRSGHQTGQKCERNSVHRRKMVQVSCFNADLEKHKCDKVLYSCKTDSAVGKLARKKREADGLKHAEKIRVTKDKVENDLESKEIGLSDFNSLPSFPESHIEETGKRSCGSAYRWDMAMLPPKKKGKRLQFSFETSGQLQCCVCGISTSESINKLMQCHQCLLKVHQACYGIAKVPKGSWICRPCKAKATNSVCVLCGYGGGAMSRAKKAELLIFSLLQAWQGNQVSKSKANVIALTNHKKHHHHHNTGASSINTARCAKGEDARLQCQELFKNSPQGSYVKAFPENRSAFCKDGNGEETEDLDVKSVNSVTAYVNDSNATQWVHMVCALWIPGTRCLNVDTMAAFDVSGVTSSSQKLVCHICKCPGGACIRCRELKCNVAFHPWCAHKKGLLQNETVGDKGELGFFGRCMQHGPSSSNEETETEKMKTEDMPSTTLSRREESTCARSEGFLGKEFLPDQKATQRH